MAKDRTFRAHRFGRAAFHLGVIAALLVSFAWAAPTSLGAQTPGAGRVTRPRAGEAPHTTPTTADTAGQAGGHLSAVPMPVTTAPPACGPKKVLFVGDSMMGQAGNAIVREFHESGYPIDARVVFHGGSNAVEYAWIDRPSEYASPRDELRSVLESWHPDVVVTNWGINKIDSLWGTGSSALMDQATDSAMSDVISMVHSSGAELFWTTIAPRNDEYGQALWSAHVNDKIIAAGVPLLDWKKALTDSAGAYQQFLTFTEDGSSHPIRLDDQLHLADPYGIERVARWTVAGVDAAACA